MKAEQAQMQKKAAKSQGVKGAQAALEEAMEGMEDGGIPMVKLGDASIAAPFTSKMPSIRSCVDVIRQVRAGAGSGSDGEWGAGGEVRKVAAAQ